MNEILDLLNQNNDQLKISSPELYANKIINNSRILKVHNNGKLIGFISYYINNLETKIGFISMVLVDDKYRGFGIGLSLVKYALNDIENAGFIACNLEVNKRNSIAFKLYSNLGFKVSTEKQNSLIMSKIF